jgi:O-methyltransferase involved in polyketide biosynthesis
VTDGSPSPSQEPVKINTNVAHPARVYDYWLGGKDNYPVDRQAGDQILEAFPAIVEDARASRAFLARAVRYLAGEAGIRQFLDIGTGLPTANNTHEVAQRVAPESRIVYVGNDPIVLPLARALLRSTPEGATSYIAADLREPDTIVQAATNTLDFSQPVALMMLGILNHIIDDDEAHAVVNRLLDAMPSGSYLVIGHPTKEVHGEATDEAMRLWNELGGTPIVARSRQELARFFDRLELLEPGVVSCSRWRPDPADAEPAEVSEFCAVGRKGSPRDDLDVPESARPGVYQPLPMPHGRTRPAPPPLAVQQGALPSDLMEQTRARHSEAEVLVLPREAEAHLQDGDPTVAIYNDSDMAVVQTLRRAGVRVDFLAEHRRVVSQFSAAAWIDLAVQVGAEVVAATVTAIAGYLTGLIRKARQSGTQPQLDLLLGKPDGTFLRATGTDTEAVLKAFYTSLATSVDDPAARELLFQLAAGAHPSIALADEEIGRRLTWVFLSYAFEDSFDARRVARSLGEADFNVWSDEWHLTPGEDLERAISEAIRSNDKLVVLLSPHSVASPFVRSEIEQVLFRTHLDRRGIDIIPALLAPCDVPEDLRSRGIVDLTQGNAAGLGQLIERLRYSYAIDFRLLDGNAFNQLVVDLLQRLGFVVESEWRPRPDSGVDLRATYQHTDPLGAVQETIYLVESKLYPRERASVLGIRQLAKYLLDAPQNLRGLLVTNGLLTSEAREFLEEAGLPVMERLSVLDGIALRRLLVQHPDLIDRYFPGGHEPTGSGGSDS